MQRRQDAEAAPTVGDGLGIFFGSYGPARVAIGRMRESTLKKYRAQAEKYVRPALGAMKVAAVQRRDVVQMLARVGGPVQRNRVQAFTSRLFGGSRIRNPSDRQHPARRITKTKETPRTRVFTASEIAAMGVAIEGLACPVHAAALRFLMLTGWRNGEALSLEWSKIDFAGGVADLPSTKTGPARKQVDALALQLIAELPRTHARVFHPATYRTLRSSLLAVCREAKVPDARLHDARRTVATDAGAAGAGAFAIRDMLGHSSLTMANRYVQLSAPALRPCSTQPLPAWRQCSRAVTPRSKISPNTGSSGHRGTTMATTDEIAGEVRIRLVIALLDEVARVRPYVPRTQLVRSITGRRDFETLLKAGRVTPPPNG